jgi:Caspase domain
MAGDRREAPQRYALLIGVDCYLPNRLPDNSFYPSLRGCVRDITHVDEFLQRQLEIPPERIVKLTATNTGSTQPPEPRDQWPTYENMVAAFKKLTDVAQPGDQVYIHYSGHGGRSKTSYPDLKGPNELDESLVPTDIGNSEARYLRDIELAHLLKTMVDKELIVTVVLDSCHSGGAMRGAGEEIAVRGISSVDTTPRPTDSLVAAPAELAATWQNLGGGMKRNLAMGAGWLPEPQGYTLLAACRPSESAYEFAFDGKERNGALTYWLLRSLQQISGGLTYKMVYDRILAKVHSQFAAQTPQLQGETTRVVFASDHVQLRVAVNVMEVDTANARVRVNAGQATNIAMGGEFAIYPTGTTDFTQKEKRLALAEITELGATASWARITQRFNTEPIEPGAQALLVNPGAFNVRRKVRVSSKTMPETPAREAIANAIAQSGRGWVEVAGDEEAVDYQVAINERGEFEIWDPAGQPLPNLRPPIKVGTDTATQVVERLVHLSKYAAIQQLENADSVSPLAGKLVVELFGTPPGYQRGQRPVSPPRLDDRGSPPTLKVGEQVLLRLNNTSSQVLNVAVLDLQPDWGVSQLYPPLQRGDYVPIDPGKDVWELLNLDLPPSYKDGTDVLKVFATVGPANFRWLELAALDQPLRSAQARSLPPKPRNALEQLLGNLNAEETMVRTVSLAAAASEEWVVESVELRVQRPSP